MIAIVQNENGEFDYLIQNGELIKDNGFETLVLISLGTDKRDQNKNGWWGSEILGIEVGSRIWRILQDGKITNENINKLKRYTEECLAWILTENIVKKIQVNVSRIEMNVFLEIIFNENITYKYNLNWREQRVNPLHKRA